MAIQLKQSTASQEVPIGPFLDDADGKTAEVSLTVANTHTLWHLTGAASMVNVGQATIPHIASGWYLWTADATDTATAGPAVLAVSVTGALPVRVECDILPANIYDSRYSTDRLQVDAVQIVSVTLTGNGSTTPWGPA